MIVLYRGFCKNINIINYLNLFVYSCTIERFNNLCKQFYYTSWRLKFYAFLSLRAGKGTKEVLVDASEGVIVHTSGDLRDFLEQF